MPLAAREFISAMSRVACDHAPSSEEGLIDRLHHYDHSSRRPLDRRVVGVVLPIAAALLGMAVGAIQQRRGRKETHGLHEFIDRKSLENLHVLEDVFSQQRLRPWLVLTTRRSYAEECPRYTQDRSSRSHRHLT